MRESARACVCACVRVSGCSGEREIACASMPECMSACEHFSVCVSVVPAMCD